MSENVNECVGVTTNGWQMFHENIGNVEMTILKKDGACTYQCCRDKEEDFLTAMAPITGTLIVNE